MPLLTPRQAAAVLRVSLTTLRRLSPPCYRLSERTTRYDRDTLEEWLERHTINGWHAEHGAAVPYTATVTAGASRSASARSMASASGASASSRRGGLRRHGSGKGAVVPFPSQRAG